MSLNSDTPSIAWKAILGVFAVVAGLVWLLAYFSSPTSTLSSLAQPTPASFANNAPVAAYSFDTPPASTTTADSAELTATQHLAQARRALGITAATSVIPKKLKPTQIAAARWHLEAVSTDATEYKAAQTLLAEVAKREQIAAKPSPTPSPTEVEESAALGEDEDGETESSSTESYSAPPPTVAPRRAVTRVEPPMVRETAATVYVTRTGEKYHSAGCQYLSRSQIPISLADARRGYSPCSRCHPPR
jgi:hypothetical protein